MGWIDTFKKDYTTEFITKILSNSFNGANLIKKFCTDKTVENTEKTFDDLGWTKVYYEFIYFYLHVTDRMIFGRVSEENRNKVMTKLEETTIYTSVDSICNNWPKEMIEKIKLESMHNYNVSQMEYSQYKKIWAEKDAGLKDTLIWEFGKMIAKSANQDLDVALILAVVEYAMVSLKDLDINSFINKVK